MKLSDFAKMTLTDPKMQPTGGVTHCNEFIQRCARNEGLADLDGLTARDIIYRFEAKPEWWKEVDVDAAQDLANRGFFVVAGSHEYINDVGHVCPPGEPDAVLGAHDHVCLVIPGLVAWSTKHEADMPCVANVGADNFYGKLASYAFPPEMPPRYWVWIGT